MMPGSAGQSTPCACGGIGAGASGGALPWEAGPGDRIVDRFYGDPKLVSQHVRQDPSKYVAAQAAIERPQYTIEKVVEVPQTVVQERVREVKKPSIIERVIQVPKPQIREVTRVGPPQVRHEEQIVEVPQVVIEERVIRRVNKVIQERLIEVPKIEYVERIEYVDRIEYREVPVDKIVEVPEIEYRIVKVERLVPQTYLEEYFVDSYTEVPVTQIQEVERHERVPVLDRDGRAVPVAGGLGPNGMGPWGSANGAVGWGAYGDLYNALAQPQHLLGESAMAHMQQRQMGQMGNGYASSLFESMDRNQSGRISKEDFTRSMMAMAAGGYQTLVTAS